MITLNKLEALNKAAIKLNLETEANELQDIRTDAIKAIIAKNVLDAIDHLLDNDEIESLPTAFYSAMLAQKRENQGLSKVLNSRLDAIPSIEAIIARQALQKTVADEAGKHGCLNSELVRLQLEKDARGKISIDDQGELVVELLDDDGVPWLDAKGEPLSLSGRIAAMVDDPQLGVLFSGNGTGSTPIGKNPWKGDSFNLTEQGKIVRENPILAKRLADEAEAARQTAPNKGFNLTEAGRLHQKDPAAARSMLQRHGITPMEIME